MKKQTTVWAIALSLTLMCASASSGQTSVTIPPQSSCATCKILLRPVVKLGSEADDAGFAPYVQIASNTKGQYVVSSGTFDGQLFVYGPNGAYLRTIGRKGFGPGEFSKPQLLAFDGQDSLHAVDASGPRYSVFTPGFQYARSVVLQGTPMKMRLQTQGGLYVASAATKAGVRNGLASFAASGGAPTSSFDPIPAESGGFTAVGRNIAIDSRDAGGALTSSDIRSRNGVRRGSSCGSSRVNGRGW